MWLLYFDLKFLTFDGENTIRKSIFAASAAF